jgi:hypothetical protein
MSRAAFYARTIEGMPGDGHTVADRLADLESGLRWLFSLEI